VSVATDGRAKRPGKYVPATLNRCGLPDCGAEIPYPVGMGRARYEARRRCPEHRNRPDPRPSKQCGCGCGETFDRPPNVTDRRWALRAYLDITHRRRAERRRGRSALANGEPGAARAGSRTDPRPVPSRDRKPKAPPVEKVERPVFADPPPVVRWRPPAPSPKRVERTVPRPSFGLTKRSA
jgi:hypothetical protein